MKVLVGCEESGVVRRAFRALGHDAWSCDIQPGRDLSPHHLICDLEGLLSSGAKIGQPWDLAIFHPPCTHLAGSGARWLTDHWVRRGKCPLEHTHALTVCLNGCRWHDGTEKRAAQIGAVRFFKLCAEAKIPRVCTENPVGMISTLYRGPDQIVQPWQFGHGETKATCLWLKNLPPLKPTDVVAGREQRVWKVPPGPDRQRIRSETYEGIAKAMAEQWGAP